MTRSRIAAFAAAATIVAAGALATSASAAFHLMKVTEVHEGPGSDVGDYVELQMYSAGQNFVGGHYVRAYDGGSTAFSTFLIPSNVANGDNQRTILIANDATVPGADFNAAGNLKIVNANGGICFLENLLGSAIDCVRWGAPVGSLPSPAGTPLALPGGAIGVNESISRRITAGCATLLDAADDTDNSAADFAVAPASPRNNATAPTETACPPAKKKCKKAKRKKKSKKSASAAAKCKKMKKKKK